jgi:transcriptional regulator with XRE-family HTH domain
MTSEEHVSLGNRIRELREDRQMTLGDLERESGVSKGYLSQLERGEASNPTVDVLTKISQALAVTVSELLGERGGEETAARRLPAGLKTLIDQAAKRGAPISDQDVRMLLGIRYRGRQPRTTEDWAFLYETIKRIIVR